jgi:hypothetical protein
MPLKAFCNTATVLSPDEEYWLEAKYAGDDLPTREIYVATGVQGATLEFTVFKAYSASLRIPVDLTLSDEIRGRFSELIDITNSFERKLEGSQKPEAVYFSQTVQGVYIVTEAALRAEDVTAGEQKQFVESSVNITRTVIEFFEKGLDVSTSLLPFISDARDFYELISGRDLITGEELDTFGRAITGVAIIAGNGNFYRKLADKLKESFSPKKIIKEALSGIPGITYTGAGSWKSAEGIIYKKQVQGRENSLRHILRHASPGSTKPSVFAGNPRDVPSLIDKAWKKRGAPLPPEPGKLYDVFIVDMGAKIVGTKGETKIRIIMEPNSTNIVTAYPWTSP